MKATMNIYQWFRKNKEVQENAPEWNSDGKCVTGHRKMIARCEYGYTEPHITASVPGSNGQQKITLPFREWESFSKWILSLKEEKDASN